MSDKTFVSELERYTKYANDVIHRYLPRETGTQKHLSEAMNYSMNAGGKRLRPILMYLSYRMFGGEGKEIEPFMASIGMIHTHSLIHDDLPALDNDMYRRGKKSTHAVFGESAAILAGDALLNCAYETMARSFRMGADPLLTGRAIGILAEKTGVHGMLGGQAVDVEMDGKPLTTEQLEFIYEYKTGALMEGSLMAGACLAGASDEQMEALEKIGSEIGIAFQIRDDILDVAGTQEVLGKPVGSDEKNNKTTYVTLHGLKKAGEDAQALTQRAVRRLDELPGEKGFLRTLLQSLADRKY